MAAVTNCQQRSARFVVLQYATITENIQAATFHYVK
jgi:hypothetical protein